MICTKKWSYDVYQPHNRSENIEIYVNRIVPKETSVSLFWYGGKEEWSVYYRVKDSEDEWKRVSVKAREAELEGLDEYTDYEFYVESDGERSMTGFAHTGYVPGTVVNYIHPEDPKYAFSGQHPCSPSILIHPDGYLLASMDIYDAGTPQNLTLIFRSDDNGKSWYHYTELFPCFWGTLFLHRGDVYMLGTSTEYGDLLIGKSTDGGKTWMKPTVLARGSGNKAVAGWHKSAMPVIEYNGRLWCGIDYGAHKCGGHMSCLASADANGNLLDEDSWLISDPLKYDPDWEGAVVGDNRGFIEGNAVVMPDGSICDFLRYSTDKGEPSYGLAGVLRGHLDDPGRKLEFCKFVKFPGNLSKFDVKKDPETGLYFSILSRIIKGKEVKMRNVLAFAYSENLEDWTVICDLINYEDEDPKKVGFQYVSFDFQGDDIIYLCRTAFNNAQSFHDNNYITFHRIENFRNMVKKGE